VEVAARTLLERRVVRAAVSRSACSAVAGERLARHAGRRAASYYTFATCGSGLTAAHPWLPLRYGGHRREPLEQQDRPGGDQRSRRSGGRIIDLSHEAVRADRFRSGRGSARSAHVVRTGSAARLKVSRSPGTGFAHQGARSALLARPRDLGAADRLRRPARSSPAIARWWGGRGAARGSSSTLAPYRDAGIAGTVVAHRVLAV